MASTVQSGKVGGDGLDKSISGGEVVVLGSRKSELALIQTRWVQARLRDAFPDTQFVIRTTLSVGDEVQDRSLVEAGKGNPGLFTSSLEAGLGNGSYDLAVHSLKDMPTTLPAGMCLAAISPREAPEDALVVAPSHKGCGSLSGLPAGAVVGTSSLRRAAILRQTHPKLVTKVVRGNLNTRLAKLDGTWDWSTAKKQDGGQTHAHVQPIHYDALILAVAGLKRMGWEERIEAVLDPSVFPYGVSQGALGIESRNSDNDRDQRLRKMARVAIETDFAAAARCRAERALLKGLLGGCQIALGVSSEMSTKRPKAGEDEKTKAKGSGGAWGDTSGELTLSALLMPECDGASAAGLSRNEECRSDIDKDVGNIKVMVTGDIHSQVRRERPPFFRRCACFHSVSNTRDFD